MLLANGVRAGGGPYRYSGAAGALAIERASAASPALAMGFNVSEATVVSGASVSNIHGIPSGTVRGWVMPVKGGALKSYRRADVAVNGSATGELGYPAAGTATISIDASAIGGLIVSTTGTATISFDGTVAIVATLNSTGTATISIDGSAALGAIASLTGTGTLAIDGNAAIMGIGYMTGTTIESGTLTPEGIAAEVWKALAAQYNTPGTMGNKLNTASAGGVDMDALAAAILAAAQITPIHADTRKMNGATVAGNGSADDLWRGA